MLTGTVFLGNKKQGHQLSVECREMLEAVRRKYEKSSRCMGKHHINEEC